MSDIESHCPITQPATVAQAAQQPQAQAIATTPQQQAQANQLLKHVIAGEQDEAEAMLRQNPALALIPETVTDHANRTFHGTAFQCAVASLDWFMWEMILKYILREEAGNQIRDIENHPYSQAILQNWQQMLQDYRTYTSVSGWYGGTKEKDTDFWLHHIGKCQHDSPMHVLQEFCNPDRPFDPVPDFKASYTLVRKLPDWAVISKIGSEFSFWRKREARPCIRRARPGGNPASHTAFPSSIVCDWERADSKSLSPLLESRTSQRVELVASLTAKIPRPVP